MLLQVIVDRVINIVLKERINAMKQKLFFSLSMIVLLTVSLVGQGFPPRGGGSFGGPLKSDRLGGDFKNINELPDRMSPVIPPRRVLARILKLDETQMAEVDALAEQIAVSLGPIREELRTRGSALRDELASEDSDPCLLGQAFLEVENLKAEIVETTGSFTDTFSGILNSEQLEKWETMKDRFRHSRPRHRRGNHPGPRG